MITIFGLSGSLRKGSYNAGLLRAAVELMPENARLETASIEGIPLYNADVEAAEGIPEVVARIKDRIAAANGLLLVTPEYNNSIPGVFKNAVDWISRPPEDRFRVFKNRAVGIIGASPGNYGTVFSQTAWLPVLRTLSMRPWFGKLLYVSGAMKLFDTSGNLTDATTRSRLQSYLEGFVAFVQENR
ncbi:MAG: NADPH-dependent FMN reductase [Deltaproteobacteria bacterium SG8_13]|nr:MAG: NADPH-dependent FMN reductase [Deltaproteobacteria bacterium SG8_13]